MLAPLAPRSVASHSASGPSSVMGSIRFIHGGFVVIFRRLRGKGLGAMLGGHRCCFGSDGSVGGHGPRLLLGALRGPHVRLLCVRPFVSALSVPGCGPSSGLDHLLATCSCSELRLCSHLKAFVWLMTLQAWLSGVPIGSAVLSPIILSTVLHLLVPCPAVCLPPLPLRTQERRAEPSFPSCSQPFPAQADPAPG